MAPYTLVLIDGNYVQFSQGALDHGGGPTAMRLASMASKEFAGRSEGDEEGENGTERGKGKGGGDAGNSDGKMNPGSKEGVSRRCVVYADTEVLGGMFVRQGYLGAREGLWRGWVEAFNDVSCWIEMIDHPHAEIRVEKMLRMALRDHDCVGVIFGGNLKDEYLDWATTDDTQRSFIAFAPDCSERVLSEEPKIVQKNPFSGIFRRRPLDLVAFRKKMEEIKDSRGVKDERDAMSASNEMERDGEERRGRKMVQVPAPTREAKAFDLDLPVEAPRYSGAAVPTVVATTASQLPNPAPAFPIQPPMGERGPQPLRFDNVGNRLDERHASNGALIQRITALHPCNNHYLRGICIYPGCKHRHDIQFNEQELDTLRYLGRRIKCRNGRQCQDPQCHAGHMCPNLRCDARSCGFPRDWHEDSSLLRQGEGWMIGETEVFQRLPGVGITTHTYRPYPDEMTRRDGLKRTAQDFEDGQADAFLSRIQNESPSKRWRG